MTRERRMDDASGTDADRAEMTALLAASLRRIHAFVLPPEAEPATSLRPDGPRG